MLESNAVLSHFQLRAEGPLAMASLTTDCTISAEDMRQYFHTEHQQLIILYGSHSSGLQATRSETLPNQHN